MCICMVLPPMCRLIWKAQLQISPVWWSAESLDPERARAPPKRMTVVDRDRGRSNGRKNCFFDGMNHEVIVKTMI